MRRWDRSTTGGLGKKPLGEGPRDWGGDDPLAGAPQSKVPTREMREADLSAEIAQHLMDVADDPVAAILRVPRFVPCQERVERGCLGKGAGAQRARCESRRDAAF